MTLAWSTSMRASATSPEVAQPMWWSIWKIFSMDFGSISLLAMRLSTIRTTPSLNFSPTVVVPRLDRLAGVFDLEEPTIGGENRDGPIVCHLSWLHLFTPSAVRSTLRNEGIYICWPPETWSSDMLARSINGAFPTEPPPTPGSTFPEGCARSPRCGGYGRNGPQDGQRSRSPDR